MNTEVQRQRKNIDVCGFAVMNRDLGSIVALLFLRKRGVAKFRRSEIFVTGGGTP